MARWRTKSDFVNAYKLERGCADCGYKTRAIALTFDHLPGFEKVDKIANLLSGASWEAIMAEIAKWEVVCANCHAIRTQDRGQTNGWRQRVELGVVEDPPGHIEHNEKVCEELAARCRGDIPATINRQVYAYLFYDGRPFGLCYPMVGVSGQSDRGRCAYYQFLGTIGVRNPELGIVGVQCASRERRGDNGPGEVTTRPGRVRQSIGCRPARKIRLSSRVTNRTS